MNYLLVHGAWQGGWCWQPLSNLLGELGHKVTCFDLPGHGSHAFPLAEVTYDTYYQCLVQEITRHDEPVVLVAHSMSGILAAPLLDQFPERISHLFLIAAFVVQGGQSLLEVALRGGPSEIPHIIRINSENNTWSLDVQKVKRALYHDSPSDLADWSIAQLQPQPMAPLTTPINWVDSGKTRDKRTYIFCEEDRDVHPITQLNILERYPCRVIELQSGHFPYLSHTQELGKILTS